MHPPKSIAALIAADQDDLIPKYGGSAANTKGRAKLFVVAGLRYCCADAAPFSRRIMGSGRPGWMISLCRHRDAM
jgi:hypothetical protein